MAEDVWHCYPVDDLRDHDIENGGDCWCRPKKIVDEGGVVIVHNAMDQREKYETGELLLH